MIGRKNRFHGLGSLNQVYKNGQTVRGPLLSIKYLASTKSNYRLTIVVSKKVHKSSVRRNRIRRRLYETIRHLKIEAPYDIIITVFSEKILSLGADELAQMLKTQLSRAKII
jgi:ribonuclease P protein component